MHARGGPGGLPGAAGAQPELPVMKDSPISKLQESAVFLQQHPDSKNQPQRKVKRHIRETININKQMDSQYFQTHSKHTKKL